ncbi:hypothetical protein, partial [Mesorhizobium sp. L2C084A000]|uniref:hypothetical protein n=1 Tax=Mesorhizobium sp. L2C084A000 TaxID=1287116 RepID=UPI0003D012EC
RRCRPISKRKFHGQLLGSVVVPISNDMGDEYLELECPNCSHVIIKKGSWLKVISNFNCTQCHAKIRIGYMTKLALFEKKRQSMNPAAQ